jgi:gephyrin
MAQQRLTVAILIVSNTAAKDPATDASESVLRGVFDAEDHGNWGVLETKIVPDDVLQIQRQIQQWTDDIDGPNLVVTTGGTGFAVADLTPEVRHCLQAS